MRVFTQADGSVRVEIACARPGVNAALAQRIFDASTGAGMGRLDRPR
jgi:hypothetical protein